MRPLVVRQMVQLRERALTEVAGERTLAGVAADVTFHHFQSMIAPAAHRTIVLPCAGIKPDYVVHVCGLRRIATGATDTVPVRR